MKHAIKEAIAASTPLLTYCSSSTREKSNMIPFCTECGAVLLDCKAGIAACEFCLTTTVLPPQPVTKPPILPIPKIPPMPNVTPPKDKIIQIIISPANVLFGLTASGKVMQYSSRGWTLHADAI